MVISFLILSCDAFIFVLLPSVKSLSLKSWLTFPVLYFMMSI